MGLASSLAFLNGGEMTDHTTASWKIGSVSLRAIIESVGLWPIILRKDSS